MLQFTNTGSSEETIYSLPFRTPTDVSLQYGMLPVTSSLWWTPQQAAAAATLKPAATPATGGILDWLKANQTAVFITAGGLFVLAMFGRRR